MTTLFLRADASTQMGTGHVMRCLALAQAWQESGGSAMLAAATLPQTLADRLAAEQIVTATISAKPGSIEDATQTVALAHAHGVVWVIVDGYQFGADYQRALKEARLRVLFIDDYGHAGSYCADLVLNQNLYAHEDLYADRTPQTRLLLGSRYVLLRREFWPWRGWQREIAPVARKVLVTLGGADPDNVTLKVLQALNLVELAEIEIVVIAGGGNPHYETLRTAAVRSRHQIRVERNVTDMPSLMAWADIAISAGGSTCYELAFMGVVALTIVLADNQRKVADDLATRQVVHNIGWHSEVAAPRMANALEQLMRGVAVRTEMSALGRSLIDGYGSNYVTAELSNSLLCLRRAGDEDCRMLWEWVNDPLVRRAAFHSEQIPWLEHREWFTRKLRDPSSSIYIALDSAGVAVGQARFDIHDFGHAVIDISIASNQRRQGYGSRIIRHATQQFMADFNIKTVYAYVKHENTASLQAFLNGGYLLTDETKHQNMECIQLIRSIP